MSKSFEKTITGIITLILMSVVTYALAPKLVSDTVNAFVTALIIGIIVLVVVFIIWWFFIREKPYIGSRGI